jgi:Fur family ferric uptake transcriptional regulator
MTVPKNRRKTDQKEAIRRAIAGAERPLTAQEILDAAQGFVPGIGIATVYRNVKKLCSSGWLRTVELPGEPSRYERAEMEHHHHFQCDDCGRVFDVPGCTGGVGEIVPDGFQLRTHEILMYGRCGECC